jgi:hypothetical protein
MLCPVVANEVAICVAAACTTLCKPGFADCNAARGDGCEVDVAIDAAHCGSCDAVCGNVPKATAKCQASQCAIDTCDPDFGDCDQSYANGCETSLAYDEQNCGVCGKACLSGEICSAGTCTAACDIVSVSTATLHNTFGPTQGQWMSDPLETLGAGKLWVLPGYSASYTMVSQYDSLAQLVNNVVSQSWNMSPQKEGTGAVVQAGFLYYNKANTNHLVKYDLQNKNAVLDVALPGAGFHNTFHYQWGGTATSIWRSTTPDCG